MRHVFLPTLLGLLLLSGCAPTTVDSLIEQNDGHRLLGAEVMELVQGNTLQLRAFNEDAHLYFAPSGKIFAGSDHSTDTDKGRWDVSEGGDLCFRMDSWWYGDLRCFSVYATGSKDFRLATDNGMLRYRVLMEQGDSQSRFVPEDTRQRSLLKRPKKEKVQLDSNQKPRKATLIEESGSSTFAGQDTEATLSFMAQNCPGCNFAGVDLGRAELIGANLAGANLQGANLSMANLRRANLANANLQKATLVYTNLPGADLRGADLRGANLKGANLIKADLTGAKLKGANLSEVLKEGTQGL
nr:pentapeptide repeat-containing protein [uncultured Desulfobulbus sp.]